jgi:amino acid transporter
MTNSAQRPVADTARPGAGLLKGKLGLGDVLFQGITHIGPAVGVIFTLPFIVSYAGAAAPVALIGASVIMVLIANTVAEFTRYMPSTGGYYSFVRRGGDSSPGGATSPMTRWAPRRCSGSWVTWPRTC